jgi:inorganic triphosphatase YgiF
MKALSPTKGFVSLACLAVLLAGCANKQQPAHEAIVEIAKIGGAAGMDGQKYAPELAEQLGKELADLQAKYDKKDYKAVLEQAPKVLADAKALAPAAQKKKAEVEAALPGQWQALTTEVPQAIASLESRLSAAAGKPGAEAAKQVLTQSQFLWKQANGYHDEQKLEQAVGVGTYVKDQIGKALAALDAPVA